MKEENSTISCSLTNEESIYQAYMPFVKGGGLFIRTTTILPLGTLVNLEVNLLKEANPYRVEAEVVWFTPKRAAGNKPSGLGMQFKGESGEMLVNKIETHLKGMLKSVQITDTM